MQGHYNVLFLFTGKFTTSTSFVSPAVTTARSLSNTFAGVHPSDVPCSSWHNGQKRDRDIFVPMARPEPISRLGRNLDRPFTAPGTTAMMARAYFWVHRERSEHRGL
jgi:hypothetical protein